MSDAVALIRTLGALLTMLGVLAGALWAVRRYNLVLPGTAFARTDKRLAVVERLSLDPRRSLALLRRDGVEHLILLAPEGHLVIESNILGGSPAIVGGNVPEVAPVTSALRRPGSAGALVAGAGTSFNVLVERARRLVPATTATSALPTILPASDRVGMGANV